MNDFKVVGMCYGDNLLSAKMPNHKGVVMVCCGGCRNIFLKGGKWFSFAGHRFCARKFSKLWNFAKDTLSYSHGVIFPREGSTRYIWVWGRAIERGIDFHDFDMRNGIDFHDFRYKERIDMPFFNKGRFCNTIASVALVHTSI